MTASLGLFEVSLRSAPEEIFEKTDVFVVFFCSFFLSYHQPHRLFLSSHCRFVPTQQILASTAQPTLTHPTSTSSANMRSPAVVFSLFAVSALSPALVYASPVPSVAHRSTTSAPNDHHRAPSAVAARGLGFLNEVFARADSTHTPRPAPTSKPKVASIAGMDLGYGLVFWTTVRPNTLHTAPENFGNDRTLSTLGVQLMPKIPLCKPSVCRSLTRGVDHHSQRQARRHS